MYGLAGTDLNLLVALHALLEEQNVSAAGRRIGLSQPATSHALRRLRAHFEDPLLVRSGRSMTATPRGLALLAELRPVVADLERLFGTASAELDPAELSLSLRLVTDDACGLTLLPTLLSSLRSQAPGLTVDVLQRGPPGRKALLRRGQADLALGYFSGAGMDLHRRELYAEDWVCVMRADHPARSEVLHVERFAGLEHCIVSPTGGRTGLVDRALAAKGLEREVVVAVPHFSVALALVARTDLVLTTGRRVAEALAPALGLAVCAPPEALDLAPYPVSLMWHPRTEADLAHRWVRDQVADLARQG